MNENEGAYLFVQGGPDNGRTIPLRGEPVLLGCGSLNNVVVDEPFVSLRHVVITETSDGFALRDLHSENGTSVNGNKIGRDIHILEDGDGIGLAMSEVTLVYR